MFNCAVTAFHVFKWKCGKVTVSGFVEIEYDAVRLLILMRPCHSVT